MRFVATLKRHVLMLPLATLVMLSAVAVARVDAQPCPVATASTATWVRHQNLDFGIEISGPPSFRPKEWANRSDSSAALFSLWANAATTLDFVGPKDRTADNISRITGPECVHAR